MLEFFRHQIESGRQLSNLGPAIHSHALSEITLGNGVAGLIQDFKRASDSSSCKDADTYAGKHREQGQ